MFRDLKQFYLCCKRVIKYLPIVWKHRNFDHGYILHFNKQLYTDLYEGVYTKSHHVFSRSEARKLQIVINLFDRLEKDMYDIEAFDEITNKYGSCDSYIEKIEGSNHYRLRVGREERMTEDQKKKYYADRKRFYAKAKYRHKYDKDMLYKYLNKYSEKWWD